MIIRFTPEADAELAEARQWYAHQHEDLDIEFMKGGYGKQNYSGVRSAG
jgi:hypothetical protein